MILNLENHKVIMHEDDYRRIMKYKEELHHCKAELESYQTNLKQHKEALEYTRDEVKKYKTERDTLIDDLSWYKAKVSRLEQRHSKLVDENTRLKNELYTVGLNQDEADDKIKEYKTLLSEISQHIGNKPSSSTYKYFRAKFDGIGIKEGE
ncbi:hypothetical protein [Staphylococcus equorum]|uniref:hypothetical protein n=1 Tax=Staphylococcus equorum TaxID=246432 RepID=UPI003D802EC3